MDEPFSALDEQIRLALDESLFELWQEKRKTIEAYDGESTEGSDKIFRTYSVFFAIQAVLLVLIASVKAIASLAIPLLAISFLVFGTAAGLIVSPEKKKVFKHLLAGAATMLPAVLMIALASSVKLVMVESNILDTVMHEVIEFLRGKDKFVCVILIYLLI